MNTQDTQSVSQKTIDLLLISPFDEDHQRLRDILRHSNWRQHDARSERDAFDFLQANVAPVVICEQELPDGNWKDVLARLGKMQCPPMLVVTSRLADDRLWSEVLHFGGYNVLAKPLHLKEVVHVVAQAWIGWKYRWEGAQPAALTA